MLKTARIHWITVTIVTALISATAGCGDKVVPLVGPWQRHTIDDTSRGADGVRLADINGDGLPDIATGWEEGGMIRVYLNPGPTAAKNAWPAVTAGRVETPEDAVLVDLDSDNVLDVVSSCEGKVKTLYAHWAPADIDDYLNPQAWQTEPFPAVAGAARWMFCLPLQIDGQRGDDLVIGAKNDKAQIGWLQSPVDPRDLAAWQYYPLADAGWIMSLIASDMDSDGNVDVVASDRRGENRGCFWLENPGADASQQKAPWPRHWVGGRDDEVMFATLADLDRDGLTDMLVAVKGQKILFFRRLNSDGTDWKTYSIVIPETAGTGKGIAVGDIDLDGRSDIVFTCENAEDKMGVMWLSYAGKPTDAFWQAHDVSGLTGVKYDRIELYDFDDDGDLDILTCEERNNLGVIWYENPTHP